MKKVWFRAIPANKNAKYIREQEFRNDKKMTITKLDLINIRGCRCEICKASRWKQKSIATGLVVTRKDRTKPRTEDNLLLICRMCYCEKGYNKHTPHKRRTFAEVEAAVRASIAASTPAPLIDQSNYFNTQAGK